MLLKFNFSPCFTFNTFLNMYIAENGENNTTNPINSPPPLPTTVELRIHFSWIVIIKEVYLQFLKRILAIKKVIYIFCVLFFKTQKK